ncbi:MAG: hypothetical protein A3F72_07620 [Bacteroidetes bacterium RIFCSPLOWO2_12_FULL_35_15]|nr:MAG: hypothetical protein A3F72_07620 [Bacteroidetes bacterium RIFCSPLOWO2_12_FULL_35_15]
MKKIAALFLLSIFLFNTVGFYFVFRAEQYLVKSEVQNKIKSGFDPSELEAVTINKDKLADVQWLKHGKEMFYNNQMYDIVKSTETSSTITFYCINDTKEKALLSKLENHINTHVVSSNPTKNDSSKKIIDTVIKLYFSNQMSFSVFQSESTIHYFISNLIYTPALLEITSPPPEFV